MPWRGKVLERECVLDFERVLRLAYNLVNMLARPFLFYRKCSESRFAKVNSCTNPSTYPLLLVMIKDKLTGFCEN